VGFFVDNGSGGIENWRGGWPVWSRMTEGGYCVRGEIMDDEMADGPGLCGRKFLRKDRFGGYSRN